MSSEAGDRSASRRAARAAGRHDRVVLGHGSGGRLTAELVARCSCPRSATRSSPARRPGASWPSRGARWRSRPTPSWSRPLFFPGGDIGALAVNGTVNDLAVAGARPLVPERGLHPRGGLPARRAATDRGVHARRRAAAAGVLVVTGDTKVVDRGKADGCFITTSGVGMVRARRAISASPRAARRSRPGVGHHRRSRHRHHGRAREGLEFETALASDSAPLTSWRARCSTPAPELRCMRDPTRGGVASALQRDRARSPVSAIVLDEAAIPVRRAGARRLRAARAGSALRRQRGQAPRGGCGRGRRARARRHARSRRGARRAPIIGEVVERPGRLVVLQDRSSAGDRIVDMLQGEQLPRIC